MKGRKHTWQLGWRSLTAIALLVLISIATAGATFAAMNAGTIATAGRVDAAQAAYKIAPDLLAKFKAAGPNGQVHYWVQLTDQADTTNNIPTSNWSEKGWYVYNTLTKKANETQKPLLDELNALKVKNQVSSIESFWIINLVAVTGDLNSAQTMSSYNAVAQVKLPVDGQIYDTDSRVLSPQAQSVVDNALKEVASVTGFASVFSPLTIQHNINEVHAPQGWALGYDGTGVVVSSMDSGVRWTHEALSASYRGNVDPPDPGNIHDYDWYDGYLTSTIPIDLGNHGSHTMGTVLGVSPNATYGNTGVAKGAIWTTVRICSPQGESSCYGDATMRGFQWTLAPTRVGGLNDPRPDLRPRVSNNSWGGSGCDNTYNIAVTNWVNAGIFPAFSNGNEGPGAGTVGTPANGPDAWGTGALATNNSNWVIAGFSSRGPSPCDGSLRPYAVAPGVAICSSIGSADNAYSCGYSGTSMASPHVAGAVAMLESKNNDLTVAQYAYALTSTAFFSSTWGTLPNNNYGYGLIQIDAALDSISVGATATPTATGTPPTATVTPTATATSCVVGYSAATATGTIIPAANDTGNACDDCTSDIAFPFPVTFYGDTYTTAKASSNGNLQFTSDNTTGDNFCILPKAAFQKAAFVYQNDLRTDLTGCTGGCGIFTDTIGTAPDRVFVVEWRATYYTGSGTANAEILFYENNPDKVSMVYGANADDGANEVTGIQNDGLYGPYTQFSCQTADLTEGLQVDYTVSSVCPTVTPVPTDTPVPVCTISFEDVPVGSTFYPYIQCLACQGIINGYPCGGDGEPCNPANDPYFRPGNNVTRGQFAKIASNSAGFNEPPGAQQYEDVAVGSTFFDFVWRLSDRGYINGYPCGGPGEPCGSDNLPYFRPNANVTRGQLSKIDANAAGFDETPGAQQYEDVLPGSTFYDFIWRLSDRGIINGYPCGGNGEPCGPNNLPYFRPGANATRGQASKIVSNTFFPTCNP
jgi:subtilisin family serine protease